MKLVCEKYDFKMDFLENQVNVLIIENALLYRSFVGDLIEQNNTGIGGFVLSEADKELKFKQSIDVVSDLFFVELNGKKLLSKIYQDLSEKAIGEAFYETTATLYSGILNYIESLIEDEEYHLEYDDPNLAGIFKALNLRLKEQNDGLLEKVMDYTALMKEVVETKCIVFLNIKSCFSPQELKKLYEFLNYKKIEVLLIEAYERESLEGEKHFIIDQDLCEIH